MNHPNGRDIWEDLWSFPLILDCNHEVPGYSEVELWHGPKSILQPIGITAFDF